MRMNINFIPKDNHNINFMMLNMPPEKRMAEIVGDEIANKAEQARPAITRIAEELNETADVFVLPISGKGDIDKNGFQIAVKPTKPKTKMPKT